jgi:hypothetical protein
MTGAVERAGSFDVALNHATQLLCKSPFLAAQQAPGALRSPAYRRRVKVQCVDHGPYLQRLSGESGHLPGKRVLEEAGRME